MNFLIPRRWHRWFYFEYWPVWLFYLPALPYWLFLAVRSRSWLYFTAANPGISHGGYFGESKSAILDKIPADFKPKSFHFKAKTDIIEIFLVLARADLSWPVVCKPDNGERGFQVAILHQPAALQQHIKSIQGDFIIQEYIDFPLEFGIFYYRFPDGPSGISSVVQKEFLTLNGDGQKTVRSLMQGKLRSLLQIRRFEKEKPEILDYIPEKEEKVILEQVGNHSKGTKFLNAGKIINPALVRVFDHIAAEMQGIHYGRFDLKVKSLDDLYAGKNIRIVEFNGATAEAAHIYQPGYSMLSAYRDVFYHMKLLQQIGTGFHKKGVPYSPLMSFVQQILTYKWKTKDTLPNNPDNAEPLKVFTKLTA